MPTFYSAKTTVQLSVADLELAKSPNAQTAQSVEVTADIERILFELSKGSRNGTLDETPLYAADGSHVWFLGKHQDMPFFMVHAGKNFFDASFKGKRNRRAARIPLHEAPNGDLISLNNASLKPVSPDTDPEYTPSQTPSALCLTIFLSPSAFICMKSDNKYTAHDVKIDVYFNGHLCNSDYVPKRFRLSTYDMSEHIIRFTGQRIGRLIEKPWIIVPPGQDSNRGPQYSYGLGKEASAGAGPRWSTLADALMVEADIAGRIPSGERSVLGEYLESLASLSMPSEVESMQRAGNANFGVIDVVITWGRGSKDNAAHPYLIAPTPLRLNQHGPLQALDSADQTPESSKQGLDPMIQTSTQDAQATTPKAFPPPKTRSEAIAIAKAIDQSVTTIPASHSEVSMTPTPISQPPSRASPFVPLTNPNRNTPNPASTNAKPKTDKPNTAKPNTAKPNTAKPNTVKLNTDKPNTDKPHPLSHSTTSEPATHLPKRNYRPAMPYHHVLTNKQTLEEEIESIAAQAAQDQRAGHQPTFRTLPRSTRASLGIPNSTSLPPSPHTTPAPSKPTLIVTLKLPAPKPEPSSPLPLPLPLPLLSPATTTTTTTTESPQASTRPRSPFLDAGVHTTPAPKRRRPDAQPRAEELDAAFRVPELSRDCVVTFAERGVLRNVRAARSGRFQERGVVMGVRFLVG